MGIRELTLWNWGRNTACSEPAYPPLPWPHYLHQCLDHMFDKFFGDALFMPFIGHGSASEVLAPRIDVAKTDKEYRFSVELPGVDEKDVEVTLADGGKKGQSK